MGDGYVEPIHGGRFLGSRLPVDVQNHRCPKTGKYSDGTCGHATASPFAESALAAGGSRYGMGWNRTPSGGEIARAHPSASHSEHSGNIENVKIRDTNGLPLYTGKILKYKSCVLLNSHARTHAVCRSLP